MEYPEDQESVNPNLAGGRPLPGASKRRLSLLEHGTPSRPQPKRKIKDRRRVSFAPDTELTSVHHFIKDDELSGGSTAVDRHSIPEIPQADWETEDLAHPHLAESLPPPSPDEADMEITNNQTWREHMEHTGAVTAEVASLQQLLQEEDAGPGVPVESVEDSPAPAADSITAAVPRLADLLEEEEAAAAPMAGLFPIASPPLSPTGSGMELGDDDDEAGIGPSPQAEPSAFASEEDSGALTAPQRSKWGFNPGCEDTLDFNLELHGRGMMGDTTHGHLFGDSTGGGGGSSEDESQGVDAQARDVAEPGAEDTADVASENQPAVQWTAPAFLPPYLAAPAGLAPLPEEEANEEPAPTPVSVRGRDEADQHPALVMDPAYSEASRSTMDTRRDSLAFPGPGRASIGTPGSATAASAAAYDEGAHEPAGEPRRFSLGGEVEGGIDEEQEEALPLQSTHAALRRTSNVSAIGRDVTEALLADDTFSSQPFYGHQESPYLMGGGAGPVEESLPPAQADAIAVDDCVALLEETGTAPAAPAAGLPVDSTAQLLLMGTPTRGVGALAGRDRSMGLTAVLLRTGGTTRLLDDDLAALEVDDHTSGPGARAPVHSTGAATAQLLIDEDDSVSLTRAPAAEAPAPGSEQRAFAAAPRLPTTPKNPGSAARAPHPGPGSLPPRAPHSVGSARAAHGAQHSASSSRVLGRTEPENTPGRARHGVPAATPQLSATRAHSRSLGGHPGSARVPSPASAAAHRALVAGLATHASGSPLVLSSLRAGPGAAYALTPQALVGAPPVGAPPPGTPQLTFQDFARLMELRFLDNLRRGTSINYADLAPNPRPRTLRECYRLLALTAPAAAELAQGVRTLSAEVEERRAAAAAAEVAAGRQNPPALREAAAGRGVEDLRAASDALRRVCRAKARAVLKDVRVQMEESQGARLGRAADALRADLAFVVDATARADALREAAAALREGALRAERRRAEDARREEQRAERRASLAALAARAEETRARLNLALRECEAKEREFEELRGAFAALGEGEGSVGKGGGASFEGKSAGASEPARSSSETVQADDGGSHSGDDSADRAPDDRAPLEALAALQAVTGVSLVPSNRGGVSVRVGDYELSLESGSAFEVRAAGPASGAADALRACLGGLAGAADDATPLAASPRALLATIDCAGAAPATRQALCLATLAALRRAQGLRRALSAARAAAPHLADARLLPSAGSLATRARLVFVHSAAGARLEVEVALETPRAGIVPAQILSARAMSSAYGSQQRDALESVMRAHGDAPVPLTELVGWAEEALEVARRERAAAGAARTPHPFQVASHTNPLYSGLTASSSVQA